MAIKAITNAVFVSSTDIIKDGKRISEMELFLSTVVLVYGKRAIDREVAHCRLFLLPNIDLEERQVTPIVEEALLEYHLKPVLIDHFVVALNGPDISVVDQFSALSEDKMVYLYDQRAVAAQLSHHLDRVGHGNARRFNVVSFGGFDLALESLIECFLAIGQIFPQY